MVRTATLHDLIDSVYRAAFDAAEWRPFLMMLARAVHSPTAGFLFYSADCSDSTLALFTGVAEHDLQAYTDHFAHQNEWMRHGGMKLSTGRVILGEELCPPAVMRRSEFYNDYLAPLDIAGCIGACVVADGRTFGNLTVMKSDRRGGAYDEDDLNVLRALMPHLQRASLVHRQLAVPTRTRDVWHLLVDAVDTGLVIVDRDGRVLYANARARALLATRDGLLDSGGVLRTQRVRETQALHALITTVASPHDDDGNTPRIVRVSRATLRRPYQVFAAAVPEPVIAWRATTTAAAVLFVTDPETQYGPSPEMLAAWYGLTRAEARVAARIALGQSTGTIAADTGNAIGTVRVLLKRAFRKTGTARQVDLMALLNSDPARVRL
jgi:DNA-binding CsgD family transcriptional regulator/PAS domain-containing protein